MPTADKGERSGFSISGRGRFRILLVSFLCALLISPPMFAPDALSAPKNKLKPSKGLKATKPKKNKLKLPKGLKATKVKNLAVLAAGLGTPGPVCVTPRLASRWSLAAGGVLERGDILVGLKSDIFGMNPGGAVVKIVQPARLPSKGKPPADTNKDGISDNVSPFSDSTKTDLGGNPAVFDPRGIAFHSNGFPSFGNFGSGTGGRVGFISTGATAMGANGFPPNPPWDTVPVAVGVPSRRPVVNQMVATPGGGVTGLTLGGFGWTNKDFFASNNVPAKPGVRDLAVFSCNADGGIQYLSFYRNVSQQILAPGVLNSCDGLAYLGPPQELKGAIPFVSPADPPGTFSGRLYVLETASNSIAVVRLNIGGLAPVGQGGTFQVGTFERRITIPGVLMAPTAIATVSESLIPHEGSVTTGVNGVSETTACMDTMGSPIAGCDDTQRLPVGNGEPNIPAIFKPTFFFSSLSSVPAGDDQLLIPVFTPTAITTGANGILETTVVPPDGDVIGLGNGDQFRSGVGAGFNGRLETPPSGDDTVFKPTTLLVGLASGAVLWIDTAGDILAVYQLKKVGAIRGITSFDFFDGSGAQALITSTALNGSLMRFDLTPADNTPSVLAKIENSTLPAALNMWTGIDSMILTNDDIPNAVGNPSFAGSSFTNNLDTTSDGVPDNTVGALGVNVLDSAFPDALLGSDRDDDIRDLYVFFSGEGSAKVGKRPAVNTAIRIGPNGVADTPACLDLLNNPIPGCDDIAFLPFGKPSTRMVSVDAGLDGICDTMAWQNVIGDDVERLPPDEDFWPAQTVGLLPGDNLLIDSPILGDDVLVTQNVITAGPNGANNSSNLILGDDAAAIPQKYGVAVPTASTIVVLPGDDGVLQTPPGGDDQIMSAQLLQVGPNKRQDSTVRDTQLIPLGQGQADAFAISPGRDGVFQSVPGGDDRIFNGLITTGPNGINETTTAGNDVRIIPTGNGNPRGDCVSAGADARADTPALGDDVQAFPVGTFPTGAIVLGPGDNGKLETPPRGDDVPDRLPTIVLTELNLIGTGALEGINIQSATLVSLAPRGRQSGVIDVTSGDFGLSLDVSVDSLIPTGLQFNGPSFETPSSEVDFILRNVSLSGKQNNATGIQRAYGAVPPVIPRLSILFRDTTLVNLDDARVTTYLTGRVGVVTPTH